MSCWLLILVILNCYKLSVSQIITWSFNCLLGFIIISYLKQFACRLILSIYQSQSSPVDCIRHRLHLSRAVRPPQRVSCILHKTAWWWVSSPRVWGNAAYPFIPSLPGPLRAGVVAPDRVLSIGQIELFDV